ncbi:MAG: hypothetical protein JWO27_3001 [Frankiales bacterium]|nr:hypothetical protein [Frankiales bacterium]
MTELRDLVRQHVSEALPAGPRDFAGVVRRVQRRRRRQVVGTTLAVVLVIAGTAVAVERPSHPPVQDVPATATAPPVVTVNGVALRRDKPVGFGSVLVVQRTDRIVDVRTGTREPGGPTECQPWTIPYLLQQDSATVVIGAYDYVVAKPKSQGCFGVGLPTADLSLDLGRALGNREVVDVSTGRPADVLDESQYLTSSQLPSGFGDRQVYGARNAGFGAPFFRQSWTQERTSAWLSLVEGPPGEVLREHVQHVGQAVVRGREGQLIRTAGGNANRCLRWLETPDDALELCSQGYTQDVLTVAELVKVADALHRP